MVMLSGSAEAEPFQSGYVGLKRLVRVKAASSRILEATSIGRELSKRRSPSPDGRLLAAAVQSGGSTQFKAGKVYSCRHTVLYCPGGVQPKEMR
jgi:hypothetical protein